MIYYFKTWHGPITERDAETEPHDQRLFAERERDATTPLSGSRVRTNDRRTAAGGKAGQDLARLARG